MFNGPCVSVCVSVCACVDEYFILWNEAVVIDFPVPVSSVGPVSF